MTKLFSSIYKGKSVLVTGHTGFKGSWLSLWLTQMGANVIGYSLDYLQTPNHYALLNLEMVSIFGDINDTDKLKNVFDTYQPDIVFHLAAQALVTKSYIDPIQTYQTNVMGTLHLLEICRQSPSVKAIVNITSDKVYKNKESLSGYLEEDELGGYDPYSASKSCVELLTSSYRNSYFNLHSYKKEHTVLLANCRAGNVIGGGDWAEDRLLSDMMKATYAQQKIKIKNPNSIRPWQHVLEPLSAYLLIGQKLLEEKKEFAEAWNFGPLNEKSCTVLELVQEAQTIWSLLQYEQLNTQSQLHETKLLQVDSSKAYKQLQWQNNWSTKLSIEKTILWYKSFYENSTIETLKDLQSYIEDANKKKLIWTRYEIK